MATQKPDSSLPLNDALQRFIQEEGVVIESLRERLANVSEPEGRTAVEKLAEIRAKYIAELESQFGEIKSREEITTQINDMFLL